jgi:hypothetical protein
MSLESLYPRREAGFVILMTTFPLLERYLRQLAGIPRENDKLCTRFYDELRTLFPTLCDSNQAKDFWQVYRNGLIHQGTFSQQTMIDGSVSHDISETIFVDQNGNLRVHPVHFAKQVLEHIVNDFSTFEGASTTAPPLSAAGPHQFGPTAPPILATMGTSRPLIWGSTPTRPAGSL